MKTINNFILERLKICSNIDLKTLLTERLKINSDTKVKKCDINDLMTILNDKTNYGRKKIIDSKTLDIDLESGNILHYKYKDEEDMIFCLNKYSINFENLVLKIEENDIKLYIFQRDYTAHNVIDFSEPNIAKDNVKSVNNLHINNYQEFANIFIEMVNKLYKTYDENARIQKFKDYAEKCNQLNIIK